MPASTEELAGVLRSCHDAGTRVRVRGGGSKQGWGRAVKADAVVDVSPLRQLREHVWQDMTCTVDAGMTWAAMQAELAQHGQFVALDPLFAERATVGGVIATNDSGALRMKYGSLRDLVIGMTVVLPDGTVAKSGGKVVKNVAGYDLPKLLTGAYGTLGVVAEVTFRLHAKPLTTRHFTLRAATPVLGEILLKLNASQLSLGSVQLRNGSDLDVALSAIPEVIALQQEVLQRFGAECIEADVDVWGAREALFGDAERMVVKMSTLPSHVTSIAERVAALGGRSVAQSTGLITASLPAGTDVAEIRGVLEAERGNLVILQQAAGQDVWGSMPDSLPLMQAIKRGFDPKHILNPGIFLDGI